jgi:hypothetical protein
MNLPPQVPPVICGDYLVDNQEAKIFLRDFFGDLAFVWTEEEEQESVNWQKEGF